MKLETPGINSFPSFTLSCLECDKEFEFTGSYEGAALALCPLCGGNKVAELYLSFPEDGPGYQKDYSERADVLRGGCGDNEEYREAGAVTADSWVQQLGARE